MFLSVQPLNPVAIEIFGWPIYWYGLIIMLGGFLGYLLANQEAKRRGLPKDLILDLLIWLCRLQLSVPDFTTFYLGSIIIWKTLVKSLRFGKVDLQFMGGLLEPS